MDNLIQSTPSIIEQAAKSPLGLFALMIIALSIIGFFFFRGSSERTRISIFVLLFVGVASFGIAALRSTSRVLSGPPSPAATDAQTGAADVSGQWKAKVRYGFGDSYEERFTFNVTKGELSGTASYLRIPRGISEGTVKGDRISFAVLREELLGEETRKYSSHYSGVIAGGEIRFVVQDDRGNAPVEFTATR